MNKFVRFLLHTVIIAVLFLFFGLVGADIDNDAGGSVSTMSIFAIFGLPLFIILHLVFDTLEDVDSVIVSFLRGALVVIGLIAVALSFLLQQGLYASEDAGTISNFFLASIMASFPLATVAGVYFYAGLQFTDRKWKGLIAPVCSVLASFVINLICVLLGKHVAPFFDGWFLFALVGVLIVVFIIVFIKCGDSWTEKLYPSDPTPTLPVTDIDEKKLRFLLDKLKTHPEQCLETGSLHINYYTPWSYSLKVSAKKISFSGGFSIPGVDTSAAKKKMDEVIKETIKDCLKIVAEGNSDYNPYSWSIYVDMRAY